MWGQARPLQLLTDDIWCSQTVETEALEPSLHSYPASRPAMKSHSRPDISDISPVTTTTQYLNKYPDIVLRLALCLLEGFTNSWFFREFGPLQTTDYYTPVISFLFFKFKDSHHSRTSRLTRNVFINYLNRLQCYKKCYLLQRFNISTLYFLFFNDIVIIRSRYFRLSFNHRILSLRIILLLLLIVNLFYCNKPWCYHINMLFVPWVPHRTPTFPQDVLYGLRINDLHFYLDTNYFRFYFYNWRRWRYHQTKWETELQFGSQWEERRVYFEGF